MEQLNGHGHIRKSLYKMFSVHNEFKNFEDLLNVDRMGEFDKLSNWTICQQLSNMSKLTKNVDL